MPSPSSTVAPVADSSTTRPETSVAGFVLGDVLVDAGGNQLLHAELDLALFRRDAEHLRFDDLADAQHVLGMIDALVGADLADVDEAFDAFGDLDESAEGHDLGDGTFDLGADGKFAGDVRPRVGEGLLEAERDAAGSDSAGA